MDDTRKFNLSRWSYSLLIALLSATPAMAQTSPAPQTANGPYLGIEGGLNWDAMQDYRLEGSVIDQLHFARSWEAGVVGGYSFSDGLRPELELAARRNGLSRDWLGADAGHDNADTAMANLWYGVKFPSGLFSVLHPYVGGGAGIVRSWYAGSPVLGNFPVASDYSTEFAYQFGAGLGYDVTRNLTVSLDYRRLWSNRGSFHDTFRSALHVNDGITQYYGAHTLMLSLRYSFGAAPISVAVQSPAPSERAATPPPPSAPPPTPVPPPAPPVVVTPPPCNPPAGFRVDENCHIIEQTVVLRAIDFQFNSVRLTAPARQTLDAVAAGLTKQPTLMVEIQGYADSRGTVDYNLRLSQLRADAVKSYLISKGLDGASLTARGYGEDKPIATNATVEGRAQNRRVAFVVTNAPQHVQVRTVGPTPASIDAAKRGGEQPGNIPQR